MKIRGKHKSQAAVTVMTAPVLFWRAVGIFAVFIHFRQESSSLYRSWFAFDLFQARTAWLFQAPFFPSLLKIPNDIRGFCSVAQPQADQLNISTPSFRIWKTWMSGLAGQLCAVTVLSVQAVDQYISYYILYYMCWYFSDLFLLPGNKDECLNALERSRDLQNLGWMSAVKLSWRATRQRQAPIGASSSNVGRHRFCTCPFWTWLQFVE